MTEQQILEALLANQPFEGMPGVTIAKLTSGPDVGFDVKFEVESGSTAISVYGQIKSSCTPKTVSEIAPWLKRMKALQPHAAFAIICPTSSVETQSICIDNGIDLIDLAGNVLINVPGKLVLQRIGRKLKTPLRYPAFRNPFGGKASRVVRVLLQNLRDWRTTEICEELDKQFPPIGTFKISIASVSKTLSALEEEVLVRKKGSRYFVPDPRRLLMRWAERYRERFRFDLRSSFRLKNSVGEDLSAIAKYLRSKLGPMFPFIYTAAAAASVGAPFVDVDRIDIFMPSLSKAREILKDQADVQRGPELRLIRPYDNGIFLYSGYSNEDVPRASEIQTFLDLYARGGRDLKQAEYLLTSRIEPRWRQ